MSKTTFFANFRRKSCCDFTFIGNVVLIAYLSKCISLKAVFELSEIVQTLMLIVLTVYEMPNNVDVSHVTHHTCSHRLSR